MAVDETMGASELVRIAARRGAVPADPAPFRTRAFGMDIESDFALPGIPERAPVGDGHALKLRTAALDEVKRGFPEDAERIAELRYRDGRLAVFVDAAGDDGYLAHAFDFGYARIAPDGREALVAALDEPQWIWQRYLTGQVLPLTALLQGHEVFHACVVGLRDQAIAIVAHSGVGKTTQALQLVSRGLDFVADDVLVLAPEGDGVAVHPGIGVANVRPEARHLLPDLQASGIVNPLGAREKETRISIRQSPDVRPLGALFLLSRFVDDRALEVERLDPVDPRLLFAATFNVALLKPERLARQLDICARMERTAAVFKVSCGQAVSSDALAEAVLEQADRALAC